MQAQLSEAAPAEQAPSTAAPSLSWSEIAYQYIQQGYVHIVPRGADHILFVLALFFSIRALRPLIWQVTSFTLAHSITLGLAAAGLINVPSNVIEPLIALSIAWVGIENLLLRGRAVTHLRSLVIFLFGLLHGLGFAGVLLDLGLPQQAFLSGLLAFNVGVELGQLSVLFIAWRVFRRFVRRPWYSRRIAYPASAAIALTGALWTIQRLASGAASAS